MHNKIECMYRYKIIHDSALSWCLIIIVKNCDTIIKLGEEYTVNI